MIKNEIKKFEDMIEKQKLTKMKYLIKKSQFLFLMYGGKYII